MMFEGRDFIDQPLEVLSYGGGVQSTAMLGLIHEGRIPRPDIVIHADTGSELPETEKAIAEIAKPFCENVLQIPFITVRSNRGALHNDYLLKGNLPMIGVRSCTENFKILPQRRYVRTIVGNRSGRVLARFWLGITTDEERRRPESKDPREPKWCELVFPLLDECRISRSECLEMNEKMGWEIIKSGCHCCPYQGTLAWRDMRDQHPELFAISLEMEKRKFEKKGGKIGLFQCFPKEPRLEMLDDRLLVRDSKCDSGAGCFL